MDTSYSFLALGDSYTIGEAVPLQKNFPYQTIQLLRKKGLNFFAPEILAKTGWTTEELEAAIRSYSFLYAYDFVSLLIGVNDQYRGHTVQEYEHQFNSLLSRAVFFANKNPGHVFVLSIPDYSVTPFAQNIDKNKIASEIEHYNYINKRLSLQFGVHYLDICPLSRNVTNDPFQIADDGLHPSEKAYEKWAVLLSNSMFDQIKMDTDN